MTRRVQVFAIVGFAVVLALAQLASIFTEAINWDEFALGYRVERTLGTGMLHGGGRPGVALLPLLPFIDGCTNSVEALRSARVFWLFLTAGYLVGVAVLVRTMRRDTEQSWQPAVLSVALLALVPAFLHWSLQVRTDHLALLCGVWSGVFALWSRSRAWLSLISGVLACAGFLCSQKLLYVGALVGVLVIGDLYVHREFRWRRELTRLGGAVLGVGVVAAAYVWLLPVWYDPMPTTAAGAQMDLFAWYRKVLGYRVYWAMLPTLIPHLVLMLVATVGTWRLVYRYRRQQEGDNNARVSPCVRLVVVAWVVLGLGVAVGLFHAAAFPYFWMTLGLFPAVFITLAWSAIVDVIPAFLRRYWTLPVWVALAATAIPAIFERLDDSQAAQRATMDFIDSAFPNGESGYQVEGALFCRNDREPFRARFTQHIQREFYAPSGTPKDRERADRNMRAFVEKFRTKSVTYVVFSHRLTQFPTRLRRFLLQNYLPHTHGVLVAGRMIAPREGVTQKVPIFVPGLYRWIPEPNLGTVLEIDGRQLAAFETLELASGEHVVRLSGESGGGGLQLAVGRGRDWSPKHSFYSDKQKRQLAGRR